MKYQKGQVGYWAGKKKPPMSQETKDKISKIRKDKFKKFGFLNSPETIEKIRKSITGKTHSESTKLKMSLVKKGKMPKNITDIMGRKGDKSNFWSGGIAFNPYPIDWTQTLRRSIRERDKYVCQLCSIQQGDYAFPVHHIDYDKQNCNPDNLITLCVSCHAKTNINREHWIEYFKGFLPAHFSE
jgi:hypothetical protein